MNYISLVIQFQPLHINRRLKNTTQIRYKHRSPLRMTNLGKMGQYIIMLQYMIKGKSKYKY